VASLGSVVRTATSKPPSAGLIYTSTKPNIPVEVGDTAVSLTSGASPPPAISSTWLSSNPLVQLTVTSSNAAKHKTASTTFLRITTLTMGSSNCSATTAAEIILIR